MLRGATLACFVLPFVLVVGCGDKTNAIDNSSGQCQDGFLDCNADNGKSCDTDIRVTVTHCGACGNECSDANGVASCVGGECAIACSPGFGDCTDAAPGCETDVRSSEEHCGACGVACALGATCNNQQCVCPAGKSPGDSRCVDTLTVDIPGKFTGDVRVSNSESLASLGGEGLITWALSSSNCATIAPDLNLSARGDLGWKCSATGTCDMQIEVSDAAGQRVGPTKLVLECLDPAPTISFETVSPVEDQLLAMEVTCVDQDSDGSEVMAKDDVNDTCGGTLQFVSAGVYSYSFTPANYRVTEQNTCRVGVTCADGPVTDPARIHPAVRLLTVQRVQDLPFFSPGFAAGQTSVNQGSEARIALVCDDIDGEALTAGIASGDTCGGSVSPSSSGTSPGNFEYVITPTNAQANAGSCVARVVCSDGQDSVETQGALVVQDVNDAPSFTSQGVLAADEETAYVYDVVCEDPDRADENALTVGRGAGDTCGGTVTVGLNGRGTYAFTPDDPHGASCTVQLTCSDGDASVSQSFSVSIAPKNDAPAFTTQLPTDATQGVPFEANLGCSDVDGDTVSILKLTGGGNDTCGGTVTSTGVGTARYAFTPSVAQGGNSCVLAVSCSDGKGGQVSSVGTINVSNTNDVPIITSTPSLSATQNQAYGYSITCSDQDGDNLTLGLGAAHTCGGSITQPTPGVGTGGFSFTPGPALGGQSCVLNVTCSDGTAQANQGVTIVVTNVDDQPVFATTAPASGAAWQDYVYEGICTDADGDVISATLAASNTCVGADVIDEGGGYFTYVHRPTSVGANCNIGVACSDGTGPAVVQTRSITVADASSCQSLGACGGESCCRSILVPGGSFPMGRSVSGTDAFTTDQPEELPEHTVTLSPYHLDKYEVTVGRFRKFVDGYDRASVIALLEAGAGSYPKNPGATWQSVWNGSLPVDKATLSAALIPNYTFPTWTASVGGNEALPISQVTWYEAFAFCAWDGGRLPTSAEWENAAAGGAENRLYPWGSAAPSRAIHGNLACSVTGGECHPGSGWANVAGTVGGEGRWGHRELAGSITEWTFDSFGANWYSDPAASGSNVINLNVGNGNRQAKGGGWYQNHNYVTSYARGASRGGASGSVPTARNTALGMRCARDAL